MAWNQGQITGTVNLANGTSIFTSQGSVTNIYQDDTSYFEHFNNASIGTSSTYIAGSATSGVNVASWHYTRYTGTLGGNDLILIFHYFDPTNSFIVASEPRILWGSNGTNTNPFTGTISNKTSYVSVEVYSVNNSNADIYLYSSNRDGARTELQNNFSSTNQLSPGGTQNGGLFVATNGTTVAASTRVFYYGNSQYIGRVAIWLYQVPSSGSSILLGIDSTSYNGPGSNPIARLAQNLSTTNEFFTEINLPSYGIPYISLDNASSSSQAFNFSVFPIP